MKEDKCIKRYCDFYDENFEDNCAGAFEDSLDEPIFAIYGHKCHTFEEKS